MTEAKNFLSKTSSNSSMKLSPAHLKTIKKYPNYNKTRKYLNNRKSLTKLTANTRRKEMPFFLKTYTPHKPFSIVFQDKAFISKQQPHFESSKYLYIGRSKRKCQTRTLDDKICKTPGHASKVEAQDQKLHNIVTDTAANYFFTIISFQFPNFPRGKKNLKLTTCIQAT